MGVSNHIPPYLRQGLLLR